ncbi:Hypothetical predicted protein [Paramuricea clavata]|uniref:Uncharacterized protein n=1 Tax=Paramuricea clavata TaxID=317549 RepID=A0A6S7K759_PARCT|nr:Hypothetical predicted protein [Paramuricea clavata]
MNPMALAGMMSMFMNQMGGMGNMGGGGMGNMGGGGGMGNMGMDARGSGDGMGGRGGDSYRGPSSTSDGYKSNTYPSGNVNTSTPSASDAAALGYGAQNSSMYGDQAAGSMGDMSAYANAMSAMFGAAGVNPANVQAALYSAYGTGTGGASSGQLGAYDQSSSAYGPARNTSTPLNRGYKPY